MRPAHPAAQSLLRFTLLSSRVWAGQAEHHEHHAASKLGSDSLMNRITIQEVNRSTSGMSVAMLAERVNTRRPKALLKRCVPICACSCNRAELTPQDSRFCTSPLNKVALIMLKTLAAADAGFWVICDGGHPFGRTAMKSSADSWRTWVSDEAPETRRERGREIQQAALPHRWGVDAHE